MNNSSYGIAIGPTYYTKPDGTRIIHAPTTLIEGVKAINAQGTESVSLQDIILEQFKMMELGMKKDICNLFVSTQGLHGNSIQLSGNAKNLLVSEYRKNMTISGEVNSNLPYIEF